MGDRQVICGLSGGVDSSVAAALVHKAIGDQLTCIFVDTGLLRLHEREQVERTMRMHLGIRLITVRAEERFLTALAGVGEPETKRKIIGEHFIRVFEDASAEAGKDAAFLVQGTLYPDVIESVSATGGPSATIKTHHNVGGLPKDMKFALIEPLRELFKDEVRNVGRELGLPEEMVGRHPFPGPGLAIRVLGEVTPRALDILRRSDAIYLEEIRAAGLYPDIWQAFAVFLPVRSVGVMGDGRTYEHVDRAARGDQHRRHDRRLVSRSRTMCWGASPIASSTKWTASTASSTTSAPSRPPRSSGSEPNASLVTVRARRIFRRLAVPRRAAGGRPAGYVVGGGDARPRTRARRATAPARHSRRHGARGQRHAGRGPEGHRDRGQPDHADRVARSGGDAGRHGASSARR